MRENAWCQAGSRRSTLFAYNLGDDTLATTAWRRYSLATIQPGDDTLDNVGIQA
jgi:hypothetical protein